VIARKIPKRQSQASNFAALVRYISNAHGKEERVGVMTITNSPAQTPADLAQAVVLTQLLNGRAKSDKTYHLLLSFQTGENPSPEVLAAVEKRMCEALGLGEHQRISAVHHDTDHLHIHVAINKIHPTRLTIHDPKGDFRIMAQTALQLEAEFGLMADNHESGRTVGDGRAEDMARIAGLEPLRDYVRRTCPGLSQAGSWQAVHDQLAAAGLTIKLQGAGLVILDGQGRGVKPSTVWRDLAKGRLEARLGPFAAAAAGGPAVAQIYAPGPAATPGQAAPRVDTKDLFARYKAEQAASKVDRAAQSSALTEKTRAQLAALKAQVKVQRKLVRLAPPGGPRAAMRAVHAATYRVAVGKILAANRVGREKLRTQARAMGWLEWLQTQALAGDSIALAALRARATTRPRPIAGIAAGEGGAPMAPDSVTKTGVFIYRTPEATVRDDGVRLHVSRGVQDKGLLAALQIAKERHGGVLTVAGDASFQARVARLAALTDPTIRFADPALERQRAAIAQQIEESQRGGRSRHGPGPGPGSPGAGVGSGRGAPGGGHRRSGPAPRRADGTRADRSAAELARTAVRILRSGVAELGGGRVQRPENAWQWPSLRDLSRSSLDDWRRGPASVLPRASDDNVVRPGDRADADRDLQRQGDGDRRGAGGASPRGDEGAVAAQPLTAAEAYIADRNAKRAAGMEIPLHAPFTAGAQDLRLAGVRNVDGQALVLLRADDFVMVMAMDALSVSRVARMKVGDPIRVQDGIVQGRGRRR
jgi:hypothetical protein